MQRLTADDQRLAQRCVRIAKTAFRPLPVLTGSAGQPLQAVGEQAARGITVRASGEHVCRTDSSEGAGSDIDRAALCGEHEGGERPVADGLAGSASYCRPQPSDRATPHVVRSRGVEPSSRDRHAVMDLAVRRHGALQEAQVHVGDALEFSGLVGLADDDGEGTGDVIGAVPVLEPRVSKVRVLVQADIRGHRQKVAVRGRRRNFLLRARHPPTLTRASSEARVR